MPALRTWVHRGRHHRVIAEKLERVARGELGRLIVNMRHSKSEFASYLMPVVLGSQPKSDHSGHAQHGAGGQVWSYVET